MTPIQSAWMVDSGNERIFVCKWNFTWVMVTTRCSFDSFLVQLKKFASLISWPPWLENPLSCIIKRGADF